MEEKLAAQSPALPLRAPKQKSPGYVAQIDTLRAISILMVMTYHWFDMGLGLANLGWGAFGVPVFFAISGFLITRILLEQKMAGLAVLTIIKNFMMRRVIRLFPIYYLLLFASAAVSLYAGGEMLERFLAYSPWYFTYTANFHFYESGWQLIPLVSGHVWSLCVEEQFYLVWPWLLLFFPARQEVWLCAVLIVLGIGFKLVVPGWSRALPLGAADFLGAGALLACLVVHYAHWLAWLDRLALPVFGVAALLTAGVWYFFFPESYFDANSTLMDGCMAVAAAALLYKTFRGFGPGTGWFWNSRALQYLGKISYGVYLYHEVLKTVVLRAGEVAGLPAATYWPLLTVVYLGVVIAVAHVSWVVIERPLLRLKGRFVA
jgi:peptidoglycan/LPS O-acetylase OafA/YrhL